MTVRNLCKRIYSKDTTSSVWLFLKGVCFKLKYDCLLDPAVQYCTHHIEETLQNNVTKAGDRVEGLFFFSVCHTTPTFTKQLLRRKL